MAILTAPEGAPGSTFGPRITELAPKGTYLATIVDIIDTFDVVRPTFEDPTKTEKVNLTTFVFGFKGKDGQLYLITSGNSPISAMRISGNEKAKLYKFLTSLTGEPPKMGWDYAELKGTPAQITVTHKESKRTPGRMYAIISAQAPAMDEAKPNAIPVAAFESLMEGTVAAAPAASKDSTEEDSDMPF
jgi:hypothetical protein